MKFSKTLIASSVAAVMAAGVMAPAANAVEVGASVGVANMYLWRGYNLGDNENSLGVPAVSGDLNISASGFYGGIWGSSGDATAGTEYDLYVGYGASFGDFSVDLSAWNYIYPTGPGYVGEDSDEPFNHTELVLGLGYGPVSVTYYDNVAGDSGYSYATLGLDLGSFSFLVGQHFEDTNELTHFNVSYAYNDNLSFTISAPIGSNDGDVIIDEDTGVQEVIDGVPQFLSVDEDPMFVVSYTLPLGE